MIGLAGQPAKVILEFLHEALRRRLGGLAHKSAQNPDLFIINYSFSQFFKSDTAVSTGINHKLRKGKKTLPDYHTINAVRKKLLTKWEKMGEGGAKWE